MKKYLLISIVLHLLVVSSLFIKLNSEEKEQEEQKKNVSKNEATIVELVQGQAKNEKTVEKKFYWGIGVYSNEVVVNTLSGFKKGLMIIQVVPNYCADSNGIYVGDVIYMVNGKFYPEEDIKSDQPGLLELTIQRGNGIVYKTFQRCKVYF